MENKNETSNSLESSKKSITEDSSEKTKNTQEKDISDTKSIKTQTEEDKNQEEIIDLPSADNLRYEFFSKEQWEQDIELYRAYLLDLSNKKEPDIYRLTSEIATNCTLTFRLYKKEIKNYYFEAKFPFEDAFKLFGYIPFKQFHSLTSLYINVIEFLIQDMRFKLKEKILENSDKAIIQFINNKTKPNLSCYFELRKVIVREKRMDDIIKSYLADIERRLINLKLQLISNTSKLGNLFFESNLKHSLLKCSFCIVIFLSFILILVFILSFNFCNGVFIFSISSSLFFFSSSSFCFLNLISVSFFISSGSLK